MVMFLLITSWQFAFDVKSGQGVVFQGKKNLYFQISFFAFLQSVLMYMYRFTSQSIIYYDSYIAVHPG